MKLTPEDFEKIELKKLAGVIRRINSDKPLSAKDEALLEREKAKVLGHPVPTSPVAGYVATWDELAHALGTTRRAIQEWKKDPRYSADCPRDRADGRKEVAAWSRFMVGHNLKRAAEQISGEHDGDHSPFTDHHSPGEGGEIVHPPRLSGSQADWQKALIREKHESARLERLTTEGTLLVATELEVPLGATFATIQTKLSQFPARVARYLVGLRDVGEIEEKLRDEIDADLRDLQAGRFTDEQAVAAAVAALPWDEASETALKLVAFDGQDRAALIALVASVATQALRLLGRQSIALTRDAAPREAAPPADAQRSAGEEPPIEPSANASSASESVSAAPGKPPARRASAAKRKSASAKPAAIRDNPVKKKRRSRKSQPVTIPPAIEGAIYAEPRKKRRR